MRTIFIDMDGVGFCIGLLQRKEGAKPQSFLMLSEKLSLLKKKKNQLSKNLVEAKGRTLNILILWANKLR